MDKNNILISGYKNLLTAAILFILSVGLGILIVTIATSQKDQALSEHRELLSTVIVTCEEGDEALRSSRLCTEARDLVIETQPHCVPYIFRP